MKKYAMILLGTFLTVFLTAGSAMAIYINPIGGGNGSETNLQTVIDNITIGGSSSVDFMSDTVGGEENDAISDEKDSYWTMTSASGSVATFIIEIAGYHNINSFGIYDSADTGNYVQLFSGPDHPDNGADSSMTVTILGDGSVEVDGVDSGVDFAESSFGYYLSNNTTYYSDSSLNAGGADQMAAFQGNNSDEITVPGFAASTWEDDAFILVWEDVIGGDRDFNDMVMLVESVQPTATPEPATMFLLGAGLLGMVGAGRKKIFKK